MEGDAGVLVGHVTSRRIMRLYVIEYRGVDGVQLAALVEGVVRAVGAQAQLEAQVGVARRYLATRAMCSRAMKMPSCPRSW